MSIDWSKAPEGTTHYHIGDNINPWRKIEGTVAYEHYKDKWYMVNSFNKGCMPDYYVPIPQETWDGQGLPPVGISVEWLSSAHGWLGGRVVGHDGSVAVVSHNDGYTGCHPHEVRPMPTPEQIAHEGRKKAISEMLDLYNSTGWRCTIEQFCKVLYDAGYRKHVE